MRHRRQRMTVTQAVAGVAKRQGFPALAGIPQLVVAGEGRQLHINLTAGMPDQPSDGIGVALRVLVELLGTKARQRVEYVFWSCGEV